MNSKFNFIVLTFIFIFTFSNCKNDTNTMSLSEYKFSDKGIVINCGDVIDLNLVNEALFTFEDNISSYYGKTTPNPSLQLAYAQFMRDFNNNRVNYTQILTPHTVEVFKVLKSKDYLWGVNNSVSHLNYNSSFFNCLATNIQDKNLNTTLKALLQTNSMSPKLFGAPLTAKYRNVINDKHLAAYVAFDLFYAKLFEVDVTQVKEREPEKVDFNKIPITN